MSFITSPGVIVPPLTAGGVAYGTGSQAKVTSAGTAGQFLQSNGAGVPVFADAGSQVKRVARTSNTVLVKANNGNLIDITSGTFNQTFTAAATLDDGWFCYIRNSGTGVITLDPNASEQIDGLTSYAMYTGECRLVQCTGTQFFSVVLSPFFATFTSSGTFITPPGYSQISVQLYGGGAGGGGGIGNVAATSRVGGGGGGAGGLNLFLIKDIAAGTNITTTIGAGGTGGAGAFFPAAPSVGNVGGNTSFGSFGFAYGGGVGAQSYDSGGGGGIYSAGTVDNGGNPFLVLANTTISATPYILGKYGNGFSTGFGGGQQSLNFSSVQTGSAAFSKVGATEYGGSGSGPGSPYGGGNVISFGGCSSVFGATGGGGGGGVNSSNTIFNGAAGGGLMPTGSGTNASDYQGTGAAGGGFGGNGTAGSILLSGYGSGGGGGGGGLSGLGGNGATPGGGGGGGGGSTNITGANGGAGGNGIAYILGIA